MKYKNKVVFQVFSHVYKLISEHKWVLILSLFMLALIQVIDLGSRYLFKEIIDGLIATPIIPVRNLIILVAGMAIISFIVSLLEYYSTLMIVNNEVKISHSLTVKVFKKLLELSLGYHEKENTGAKLTKIQHGVDSIRNIYSRFFWDLFPTLTRILFTFGLFLFIDWRISLIYLIIVPLFIIKTLRLNIELYSYRKKIRSGFETVYGNMGQSVYNIKTVQAYVQEANELRQTKAGVGGIMRNQFKFFQIMFAGNFIRYNLITIGTVAVIGFGAYFAYIGTVTPGELVLFLTLAIESYLSLFQLSRVYDNIMEAKVGVERVTNILNTKPQIDKSTGTEKINLDGQIEFNNVYFDYGEGNVIRDFNLKIKPGEVVAVVGPSGGGKSTLVKLLYRYFDVSKGAIFIDGVNLKDLDLEYYRSQLGIVTQDIDIFNDSIEDNIKYGRRSATLKEVKQAAKIANAAEFIEKLSKKYKSVVGERGIKLSGGQKQRVGIARAILVDPKILILDEATSSLDAESEEMIKKAIDKVIKDRTTIIVAHRLSTIQHADRIVVVDDGKIVEQGTHKSLLRKRGVYSRLIKLQIGGYLS
ncbi:hypothetical protein COT97_03135 [Candidatus Falkowbacteria bacterium CG10_big_fil_rev_8_21_14_0_10_39_11]|uniref:ABC transporter ATP-binding protein n=1 Tax=Candidatus Falkowbacteria bacterium CG10_big_fil_rev_8_21_14_0_10_39_11 TaxID=1974565 RepID=A0A2H0V4R7_9BACT|nr:MAG: hypothetical protein COT97_03135 [Candidatus Falkowbacteria bacterium CG10_big_fil_rev_8_21_14_0_10_39_11]